MILTFDEAAHAYQIDGQPVPSVTQVLRVLDDFEHVPFHVLEAARVFGSHVHHACHLYNMDELDTAALDPALVPYVAGWARFLDEEKVTVIESERRVAHPRLKYAGTFDVRMIWRNRQWLADIKSGALPVSVGPQTSAYLQAWQIEQRALKVPGVRLGERQFRCAVQLDPAFPKGYKVTALNNAGDFNLFLSCLNVYKAKNQCKPMT